MFDIVSLIRELLADSVLQKVQVFKYENRTELILNLEGYDDNLGFVLAQSAEQVISIIESIRQYDLRRKSCGSSDLRKKIY